ncbi:MAG: hypothetical protein HFG74_08035 [Hungatella sp.]|nr:hypothetical protein [Hungatella sp.]
MSLILKPAAFLRLGDENLSCRVSPDIIQTAHYATVYDDCGVLFIGFKGR